MFIRKSVCFVAALVFGFTALISYAEEAPPRGVAINIFQVKPGGAPGFEQVSAKFKAAADKVGSRPYIGYSAAIGNNGQYAFASAFNSFGELAEQQDPMSQVYSAEELQEIGQMFRASVESTDSYIIVPRPDLGIAPPEFDSPPEILLLIQITVKQGMSEQLQEYMGNLVEATKATAPDVYWNTFQPGLGSGPIWRVGIPMNWVDLDTPNKPIPDRLNEHFGKRAGERIYESGQDAIESISFNVVRVRQDLSHTNAN